MIPRMKNGYLAATVLLGACLTPGCGSSGDSGSFSAGGVGGIAGEAGSSSSSGGSSAGTVSTVGGSSNAGGMSSGGSSAAGESNGGMAGNGGNSSGGMSGGGGASGGSGGASGGSGGTAGASGGTGGSGGASGGSGGASAGSGGAGGGSGGASGGGGAPGCGADGVACPVNGGSGICASQVCVACTSDPQCVTAYGVDNLCLTGSCTPGDCRVDLDCNSSANGSICGASQPNFCGKCTSDTQCTGGNICDITSGKCVANSCAVGNGNACTQNPSDVCCSATCSTGTCCSNADCGASTVCHNHTCTACDAVTGANPVYLVDPVNGDDGTATGSGTSASVATASCSFATITRALQAIGPSPAAGTVISVIGASSIPFAANAKAIKEVFPIDVPKNVIISAQGGLVTVKPPASSVAFSLAAPASGIDGAARGGSMIIEGTTHNAFVGVHVGTGSTDGTILRSVTIQNFVQEGILMTGSGVLGIKEGVSVLSNGLGSPNLPGLHITGSAHANIIVPNGLAMTSFNKNGQHGILVSGTGYVNIQGSQSGGVGTIECLQNDVAGLAISQTPGAGLPVNTVNGLVVAGTTNGNGIRIEAGSNVNVTNSSSLANAGSGILITTSVSGAAATRNNSIANIVLGSPTAAGNNTFQASVGPNAGAGICLQLDASSGTLMARGNHFSGGVNCATTPAVLSFDNKSCGNNRDLGLLKSLNNTAGNDIDVLLCTHL